MSFINLSATDLVVSNDGVTAPAWSTGTPTLTSSQMYSNPVASEVSSIPEAYTDVYATSSLGKSPFPQFSVAYGHISGSGSTAYNTLVPGNSPTKTLYGQFRNLVYADENTSFNFGTGNNQAEDIYVVNVNRACYRESLFPGTFNIRLVNGSNILNLTNDSNDVTTISYLDCGRVYTLVTGSNGNKVTTAGIDKSGVSGSYGFFLPDVGLLVFNPKAISAPVANGGLNFAISGVARQTALVDIIKAGQFTLNSYETVSSDYVFVRVPNNQFNYTTNPSVISGSGALIYSTMINNPQTYMTTVGLYNDNQELLAVAKLSKPLVKDFTKEALIQVKLNW